MAHGRNAGVRFQCRADWFRGEHGDAQFNQNASRGRSEGRREHSGPVWDLLVAGFFSSACMPSLASSLAKLLIHPLISKAR